MTYITSAPATTARHREGTAMLLLHEAMARSRRRELEEAARRYALMRYLTAGRRWARLARFAERRAVRARAAADHGLRPATPGR